MRRIENREEIIREIIKERVEMSGWTTYAVLRENGKIDVFSLSQGTVDSEDGEILAEISSWCDFDVYHFWGYSEAEPLTPEQAERIGVDVNVSPYDLTPQEYAKAREEEYEEWLFDYLVLDESLLMQ